MYCARIGIVAAFFCAACSSSSESAKTDADYKSEIVSSMHASLLADVDALHQAALDVQAAAPPPSGRGWDKNADGTALESMRAAWLRARVAYEHIEGALAPLFPEIDAAIDARYDDFLETLGAAGDPNLFDDDGVTGMHAIERILWSDSIPERVVSFERSLPGYRAAAMPSTDEEARLFKTKLCERLVRDTQTLRDQWKPQRIDLAGAYQGLVALMNEQREKVAKASTNEEESRYAQRTLFDLRANLEGTTKIYGLFRPWIASKDSGSAKGTDKDATITRGFDQLRALYERTPGDAMPAPPATWSAESPSAADLESAFGKLYRGVKEAVEPTRQGSVVFELNAAAALLSLPGFEPEK